jgi:predicted nuclease of predicted toxin-antitoxin system
MKFLADMGISMSVVAALRQAGHDALHLRDEGLQRLEDATILQKARVEGRIVLTFDLDLPDLMAGSTERTPSVILFRLRHAKPAIVTARLLRVLSECERHLVHGAVIVVEASRYRVRRLPIAGGNGAE